MKLFIERNSLIHIALLATSVLLGVYISPWLFAFWLAFQCVDDVFYYCFGFSVFNSEIRIQRGYQFANLFLSGTTGDGRDYGFNLYDGNLTKIGSKAQIDKWEFMLKELQIGPGDSLIDIGCGNGDWLNYAKSKGINTVGVNISVEQADVCRSQYGLDVICCNWKDISKNQSLRDKLYAQFDAVTFMDTIEHYVPAKFGQDIKAQDTIYSSMFELAHKLLKKNSLSSRIFISCLHRKNKGFESLREAITLFLLDKYHSGCYPIGDHGLTKNASPYFSELKRYDKTEDYRLTSVLDRNHFGAPKIKLNLQKVLYIPLLLLLDPCHIHKWVEIWIDGWMWWHFGDCAWDQTYGGEQQTQKRRATLWWIVLQTQKTASSI